MKNLKTIILSTLVLSITFSVSAQSSFGGKLGLNLASWADNVGYSSEGQPKLIGFQIGAIYEAKITEKLFIQSAFTFLQKGLYTEYKFEEFSQGSDKIIFNYIELPILAKLTFGGVNKNRFFAMAGPSMGLAYSGVIRSELIENGVTTKTKERINFDDSDSFSRLDISFSVGLGINVFIESGKFFFETRYLLGLTDLEVEVDNFTIKNRGIGLAFGYLATLNE